jgi:hypothetical protein
MSLVHFGQPFDVGARGAIRKSMPPISSRLHFAALLVTPNQARHLRPAQPGHLGQVAPQQSPGCTRELAVVVLTQPAVDPGIQLLPVLGLKAHLLAGFQKRPHLLQA